jgi:hypothetical protein
MNAFNPQPNIRRAAAHETPRGIRARRARAAIASAGAMALGLALSACSGDYTNTAASYVVGGSVAGLTTTGLVLANGSDTASLAAGATSFVFPTALASGSSYAVTVATQPANATCTVAAGSGSVGTAAVTSVAVSCVPIAFSVGGSVTGLTAAGLVLANGADTVAVAANATGFTLPTRVTQGASYTVTVQTQPAGEHCSLTSSTGTIAGGNVTNVAVACAALSHLLGGTISGLPSTGLVLANGSDTVSPAAGALTFTFAVPVAEGGAYAVSVKTQPPGATCSVGSGSGTMGTSDIASVQVTCSANAYHLSGTIAGLTASGLILANGTDTVNPPSGATTFAFARTVAFGGSYSVTVKQQPTGITCVVGGTYPATMGAGDVTNIGVTCNATTQFTLIAGRETCPTPRDADGTGAAASIGNLVTGMAYDAAGNLYVATAYQTLRKITPAGVVTTLAGQYNGGNTVAPVDGTGAAAVFSNMQGIATDSAGNIYVIDGDEIRKVTQAGVVTTLAGSTTRGSANGTGAAAGFEEPLDLIVDPSGTIYVADQDNNEIRKITPAGVVTVLAGSLGAGGYQDGTGTAAVFNGPRGIVLDATGNLFVVDYANNVIRKVTPAGVVTTFVGNPAGGFADGTGAAARFGQPWEMSIDAAGNLYVSDNNHVAIRKITPAGVVTTVAVTAFFTQQTGLQPPAGAVQLPALQSNTYYIANSAGVIVVPINCALETIGP